MQKEELRKLLTQPYKTDNWKKVTDFVFPNVSYLQKPQDIPIPSKFQKISDSFRQMGNVQLNDGKNLAIFEVHVSDKVNLSANRVQLRELVSGLIDQERNHGVLVIYEQGRDDYRFTFTAKSTEFDEEESDFIQIETDAKRYTYILGKNESCKTATNRFWELKDKKDSATIKDVEQAFSVERLNKEFFNKYKEFYENFVQYLTGKRFVKEKGKWVEKVVEKPSPLHKSVFQGEDKLARNFVKLLLGRLVFIQFLQKKGWMGVPAGNKKWDNGDKEFLLNLFKCCKEKASFHSKYLYPLFYQAFNTTNRPNDIFKLTNTRIPYLNGGLFENEYPNSDKIDFPERMFEDLLDFFSQYNFTIDENDPLDHEVGIDPEMLGHIFENLLEDNKDKGAFYTPKPIVQYICQESLKEYLKTYLIAYKQWPIDEIKANELEEHLQNFIRRKTAGQIIDYDEYLAKALKEVKVCDPAIGSGAFPMGILNEIYYCTQVLFNASPDVVGEIWDMQSWSPDVVKKNIIQHSIYGVDIEKGAVDIARLRFWLSLIVDEKEPYPLPNLDFKIMQGNSLLESYEEIDLSYIGNKKEISNVELDLFGSPKNRQSTIFDTTLIDDSKISELIEDYFNAKAPEDKQELKKKIDEIIHHHIDFNLGIAEKRIQDKITDIEFKLSHIKPKKTDTKANYEKNVRSQDKLKKALGLEKENLKNLQTRRKELHRLQNKTERPYFLWNLYFKDVFDRGGFDIVIGNPPYVQLQKMGKQCDDLQKAGYNTFERTGDIYCLFYELGCEILKPKGCLTYITSNKWMRAGYGECLRKYFIDNSNPITLIDFGGYQVFDTATVDTNIITIQKSEFLNKTNTCVLGKGFSLKNMSDYFRQNSKVVTFDIDRSWVILSQMEERIRHKIESIGLPLKNWDIKINYGIKTGFNDAFIINNEQREELIKKSPNSDEIIRPILRGKHIKKYGELTLKEWIIIIPCGWTNSNRKNKNPETFFKETYPAIYQHFKEKAKLESKGKGLYDRDDQGNYWWELRPCDYMEEFEKEKVLYIDIMTDNEKEGYPFPCFSYASDGVFTLNTSYFIIGDQKDLKYLLGILNSKVGRFIVKNYVTPLQKRQYRMFEQFVETFPIPMISGSDKKEIIKLVEKIIVDKSSGKETFQLEQILDKLACKIYGFTNDETDFILSQE